jgi:hypothetical protein
MECRVAPGAERATPSPHGLAFPRAGPAQQRDGDDRRAWRRWWRTAAEERAARCGGGGAVVSPGSGGGDAELGVVGCRVVSSGDT